MVNVLRIFGEQLFPERQLLLKSSNGVRHIALPGWLQAAVVAACLISVGGIAYLAVGFARLHEALDQRIDEIHSISSAEKPLAMNEADLDNMRSQITQLRNDLAAAQQKYAAADARYKSADAHYQAANTRYLKAHDKIAAVASENEKLRQDLNATSARANAFLRARDVAVRRAREAEQALNTKVDNLTQLAKNLGENRSELQQSEAERTALQNRVQQLKMELQAANNRVAQMAGQAAVAGQAAENSPHLRQVANGTGQAKESEAAGPAAPARNAAPLTKVPPVPAHKPAAPSPHAQAKTSELERLLASTGIDINRMLKSLHTTNAGEGGPYIALGSPRAQEIENQERLKDLKKLAKMLPLGAPLAHYVVTSGFGPRIDPINHLPSFHPGIDLAAPYKSPVYSTGPGRVVFTGWKEGYGRTVEINHGHGIVTLYAHLHRILVARGERVHTHEEIGQLGSTGRSTGPHVHYEIDVKGTPLNPAKFIAAGKSVKNVVQISDK